MNTYTFDKRESITMQETLADIKAMLDLKDNWDGDGAAPVSESAIANALDFVTRNRVEPVYAVPGPNGEIAVLYTLDDEFEVELIFYESKTKAVLYKGMDVFGYATVTGVGYLEEVQDICKKNQKRAPF